MFQHEGAFSDLAADLLPFFGGPDNRFGLAAFGQWIGHWLRQNFETTCPIHVVKVKCGVVILEEVGVNGIGRERAFIFEGSKRSWGDGDADLFMHLADYRL